MATTPSTIREPTPSRRSYVLPPQGVNATFGESCLLSRRLLCGDSPRLRLSKWERRQAGEANRSIGRRLGRSAGSIRAFVESSGGVRPEPRRRSPGHLSLTEREETSRGLAPGISLRVMACRLGGLRQRCHGKGCVTVDATDIGRIGPIGQCCVGLADPRWASWWKIHRIHRGDWRWIGVHLEGKPESPTIYL